MPNKLTIRQLKEKLQKYDDESLVLISHGEGLICPDLIQEVSVRSIVDDLLWDAWEGEFRETSNNDVEAVLAVRIDLAP